MLEVPLDGVYEFGDVVLVPFPFTDRPPPSSVLPWWSFHSLR